jgi:predicted membrane protein
MGAFRGCYLLSLVVSYLLLCKSEIKMFNFYKKNSFKVFSVIMSVLIIYELFFSSKSYSLLELILALLLVVVFIGNICISTKKNEV